MYKILYPKQDATIYERYPERNTGVDQILEIKKYAIGEPYDDVADPIAAWGRTYNSRILIQFDLSAFQSIYDLEDFNASSAKYYLTLYSSESEALQTEYTLWAHMLSAPWRNGNGYYNDEPEVTNGVSWYYRDGKQFGNKWHPDYGVMESTTVSGGGTWNEGPENMPHQSFSFESPDIRMDVTEIVNIWLSGLAPNYGFIIKHSTEAESDDNIYGSLKFFSRETHTIYIPRLEIYYADVSEVLEFPPAESFMDIATTVSDSFIVYPKNLKSKYTRGEISKLKIGVRPQFETKTYESVLQGQSSYMFPEGTLFSIVDYVTGIAVVPFDEIGTQVRTDDYGHFIILDTTSLLPVRFYKIIFKIFGAHGVEEIIDTNINFRVEK